ncbi:hypothetical protein C8035_v005407 [Colletotrichum spinosum]|uniref:Xylanolytic transcriptional activator regulatory domain-containing protein n=1 Tax=Colletotrichum spinosum TaxID=1347390 RepID=A0A4R8QQF0_9PEZI|nr:hypothetical protein C8035_v005407 [Colletotrichum spinosum]
MSLNTNEGSVSTGTLPSTHQRPAGVAQGTMQMSDGPYGQASQGGIYPFGDASAVSDPPSPMEAMLDMSDFFDSVGLDIEHGFDFFAQAEMTTSHTPDHTLSEDTSHQLGASSVGLESVTPDSGAESSSSHRLYGSIPDTQREDDFRELKPLSHPWKVSEAQRLQFDRHLKSYVDCLGGFKLPSRLSISRYIAGYVDGFSNHHPFIHMPTFCITNFEHSPELVIALLAVGASFRYESRNSLALYRAGRAIVLHRQRVVQPASQPVGFGAQFELGSEETSIVAPHRSSSAQMDTLRAVLLLATFASWQQDRSLARESLEYQPLLARIIRDDGLVEGASHDGDNWHAWARTESDRRVKLSAFCFLNLQSLVFNVPPALLGNEIELRLPVTCDEWLSTTASKWLEARAAAIPVVSFKEAFVPLIQNHPGRIPPTSPFGNFVLMHALLQRLIVCGQLSLDSLGHGLSAPEISRFEVYLHRWREQWCKAPESVLDVKNTKGSLSWTATSLLGLAHVRLHFDLGKHRRAYTGDPKTMAFAAYGARPPRRGPRLVYALLHAVHALNIPVQLGIDYIANCQSAFWSLQHCFCSFETSIFLSKWLFLLADSEECRRLDANERQIIQWLECVVNEALASTDDVLYDVERGDDTTEERSLEFLGSAVIKLTAKMFEQCNSAWPIMKIIGQSLQEYSKLLDARDRGRARTS